MEPTVMAADQQSFSHYNGSLCSYEVTTHSRGMPIRQAAELSGTGFSDA